MAPARIVRTNEDEVHRASLTQLFIDSVRELLQPLAVSLISGWALLLPTNKGGLER